MSTLSLDTSIAAPHLLPSLPQPSRTAAAAGRIDVLHCVPAARRRSGAAAGRIRPAPAAAELLCLLRAAARRRRRAACALVLRIQAANAGTPSGACSGDPASAGLLGLPVHASCPCCLEFRSPGRIRRRSARRVRSTGPTTRGPFRWVNRPSAGVRASAVAFRGAFHPGRRLRGIRDVAGRSAGISGWRRHRRRRGCVWRRSRGPWARIWGIWGFWRPVLRGQRAESGRGFWRSGCRRWGWGGGVGCWLWDPRS